MHILVGAQLGASLGIRKTIYTTNDVESLNRSLRKIIKTRAGFPNEEVALKLLFLAVLQGGEQVDNAERSLPRSLEPLYDSVTSRRAIDGRRGP